MLDLIEKLKAATGPCRHLDQDIFDAVTGGVCGPENSVFWRPESMSSRLPIAFTASLDDAVKLIPPGMFWLIGHGRDRPDEPIGGAQVFMPGDEEIPLGEGEAATAALAVCIAALEARLAQDAHKPGCICPLCRSADKAERLSRNH